MAVSLSTRARQWLGTLRKSLPFPVTGRGVWSSWSSPAWNDFTFDRLAHEGYRLNAAVNICIQKLATSYQQASILVSDRGQLVEDSPIGMLLNAPNPLMSWHELAIIIQVYKSIGGACRLHKVRGDNGEVLELWPYHIGQIGAIPGTTQWIDHYVFTSTGQKIDQADIIDLHWPSVDPRNVWEALPPLMAVAREVDTDSEATRYLYALLYNDAVPMTIIKTKRTLTDTQFARLAAQFQNRHGGSNRGTVAILEEDADVSRMALNLEEMAFEAMRRVPESRIAAMFSVPAMYAGLTVGLTQSTYNNVSEARKSFFEDTIIPQATLDDGAIARALEPDFGKFSIHRAWGRVPALQENLDGVYTRELNAFKSGTTIRNEARARMGLPAVEAIPLPPGVPPYPPTFGYEFYSAPQPTIPAELMPPMEPIKRMARKARADAGVTRIERRIETAINVYLAGEYAKGGLEGMDEGRALLALMSRFYPQLIENAFNDARNEGVLINFSLDMPEVQQVLNSLAKQIVKVSDTTRDEVRRLVGLQAENGWSTDELAREIRNLSETRTPIRAVTIARTETGTAYNLGALAAYKAGGITHVMVLDGEDDEPCASANGSRWTLAEAAANPLGHPNCTRAFSPIVEG